jgi:Holliday junction DNA helicase RuvB
MAIEHDELTRIVGAKSAGVTEDVVERAQRPRRLDEYIGQAKILDQHCIFI